MRRFALLLGLTAVIVGYFAVWLPHEAAGLSYVGLEMGEQAKFLPQVRSGEIIPGRSLFYLPPVTLGLTLILLSSHWSMRRWQTWAVRLLAIALSLIALPAFEAFGAEAEEWLWRTLLIGLVLLTAAFAPLLRRLSEPFVWALVALISLTGGLVPMWLILQVNGAFAAIYQTQVPVGAGAYLNLVGQLLVASIAVVYSREAAEARSAGNHRST